MGEDKYDSKKPSKYLMYFDVNNLYGWAMSEPLPCDGFQWVDHINSFNVFEIVDDANEGYILEVDLKYSTQLHDLHKPSNSNLSKLTTTL